MIEIVVYKQGNHFTFFGEEDQMRKFQPCLLDKLQN